MHFENVRLKRDFWWIDVIERREIEANGRRRRPYFPLKCIMKLDAWLFSRFSIKFDLFRTFFQFINIFMRVPTVASWNKGERREREQSFSVVGDVWTLAKGMSKDWPDIGISWGKKSIFASRPDHNQFLCVAIAKYFDDKKDRGNVLSPSQSFHVEHGPENGVGYRVHVHVHI